MPHGRLWLALSAVALSGWGVWTLAQPPKPAAEDEPADPAAEEDAKEAAVAERFRKVLETNPRRGTALDRLYGYHVERGTLDQLVAQYADRTAKDAKDGTAWMIVGLIESQRGRDAVAVEAFKRAEANLPDSAVPGYYLGQSLVLVGQPDAAAEAFERAITRKPNRNDLLDIFQALGRVYQRAQRTDKALAVWDRLEKLYPDDPRVQEQIATTLVEEGQFAQALPRLEKLAKQTDDKYRQASLMMDAADLKVKLKKTTDALADFEKLLADLNPDSWLYRDVRRRVEDVFLRNDDLAGLAAYYEKWLEKNPTDVDAIARLAKTLTAQGRTPEARQWLEKGIAAAPTNRGLRQALIDQSLFAQDYPAAAREYEAMDKADPNNPDTLREWGKLLMRDAARPEDDRKAAAATVWKRMLEKKPNDPVTASQVADLMRSAGIADEAAALYKRAVELAPTAAQYREYLGEFYHSQGKSADALAAWRPIAEGANRTSKNLARLAEVFAGFGYKKEAVGAMADAVSLEGDDFTLLMTYADLLHQDGRNDAALEQIAAAERFISNPEEAEQTLIARIAVYQDSDQLAERIDDLRKEIEAGNNATADRWLRLARFYEANRQTDKATEAVVEAGKKDPKSVPALTAAARIYESAGNLLAAAEANRKLAALDRRFRTEYLQAVAKLEQRLGRKDQALQAGRDLLAASPGNPEVYKFFADLCFQLGDQDEGLDALRRSVRANPSDPQGLLTLANALAERLRQGEAIELLWRAFEKTDELEGKLGVIDRLTQLYLENNQFDRLMERLERERREAEKAREMTVCVAQAYATAGDLGTARQQVERLLTEGTTRDTHLLGQLVTLCEQEGDLAAGVKYQRQLSAAAPNNYDHKLKLAQLLTRAGESDEAADIWVKLVSGETEPHRNLTAIDMLLAGGKQDAALAILSRMLATKPGDWELIYREGAALAAKNKPDEAAARFNAILALKHPDDEPGEMLKFQMREARKKKQGEAKPAQPTAAGQPPTKASAFSAFMSYLTELANTPPLTRRRGSVGRIRQAAGMDNYYGGGQQPFYSPSDYGEARMAGLAWLSEFARAKGQADEFAKRLRQAKDAAGADPRAVWDWYYFQTVKSDAKDVVATALTLSKGDDPAGLLAFLNTLGTRTVGVRVSRSTGPDKDTTPPLPPEQLDRALSAYRKLKQVKPEWVTAAATNALLTELKRAKRTDDEKAIYRELVDGADTVAKVQAVLPIAAQRNDMDAALALYAELDQLQPAPRKGAGVSQLPSRTVSPALVTLMGRRTDDKNFADARKVLDAYLANARRLNQTAPRSASPARRVSAGGLNFYLYSKNPSGQRYTQLAYPTPNDYFDQGSITLLYNAYHLHKQADVLSDLFAHFRSQLDAAPPGAERIYLQLALGYLHWWNGEKEEALARMTQAVEAAPGDYNLLLEVADLREKNGEPEAALALLDSIAPVDTAMTQRREEAAFRAAERLGNLDRAREAAGRLFGLRLDSDKQLDLAGKMHRLGLHEMAETVLNRAQKQAGNKTATLVRLMVQYQGQNQPDLAVQIARQILRKGPSAVPNPSGGGELDSARQQAIGVLVRSGQLKEMIERAEAQLKASPKSVQILQTLAGYYQAAGDKDKLKAALLRTAEVKPDDGKLRYQLAEQLQQAGDTEGAIAQYKAAYKLEPSLLGNSYWRVANLFSQANKLEELGQLYDELDLRKMQYYYVTDVITTLIQDEKTRAAGLRLFKRAWEAFPRERSYILSNFYDETVWKLPEIFDYAKQSLIPREDADIDPWQGLGDSVSYNQNGRVEGVISRMLAIARKQQRLPELRGEVAAAVAKRPDWTGGKALLAVIDIQSGNKSRGIAEWKDVFDDPKADIPAIARFILVQELEFYSGAEEFAVKTLEVGVDDMAREGTSQFLYSPANRLAWWYEQTGRTDDARKLIGRLSRMELSDDRGYGSGTWDYIQVQNGVFFAGRMLKFGDPIEAIRLYNGLLADKDRLAQAEQNGGEQYTQQIEQGMKSSLKAIKPSTLPAAVGALLAPREPTPADPTALDLVLVFESRDLSRAALGSVFASALKATDKAPEVRKDALAKLADLTAKHPADVSVRTAAALAAFADGNPDAAREAVDQLVKLLGAAPLEPLPANGKANARQRAEALRQVPVWLVAVECFGPNRETLREAGEKLAARALDAAKRQTDPLYAAAILRQWGQLALDRGDRAKAEALWGEMLEAVLPKPAPAAKAEPPKPAAPTAPATPAPAGTGAKRSAEPRTVFVSAQVPASPPIAMLQQTTSSPVQRIGNVPILTADQFQQAYELAVLAADNSLPALSLRAMREAVRGGPPVPPPVDRRGGGSYRQITVGGVQYLVSNDAQQKRTSVDQALVNLVPKWKAIGIPPADIYAVLASAVLPDARPAEVFAFTEPKKYGMVYKQVGGSWTQTTDDIERSSDDRGLNAVLCDLAVEAGRADDLRAKVEARANQPLGEFPARALLVALAVRAGDDARAAEALTALGERAAKASSTAALDAVAAAGKEALTRPALEAQAGAMLQKVALQYAVANNLERAEQIGELLVGHHLDRGNAAAAKSLIDAAVTAGARFAPGNPQLHVKAAEKYLRAGYAAEALRELGLVLDEATVASAAVSPAVRGRRPEQTLADFPRLARLLLDVPAAKRYEVLKAWTLPADGRKSIRYYVGTMPGEVPPPPFAKLPPIPTNRSSGTMLLLADAAKDAGKGDELLAAAEKLAADKVENAELLQVLTALTLGKGKQAEPAVKAFAEAALKRMTEKREPVQNRRYYNPDDHQAVSFHPSELLFAELCLANPALAAHGEALLAPMQERVNQTGGGDGERVRAVRDRLTMAKAGAPDALAGALPPRWRPTSQHGTWFAHDGYATCTGSRESELFFDAPLTGTFEFSVDAHDAFGSRVGYGGVTYLAGYRAIASSLGGHDTVQRQGDANNTMVEPFSRYTVQVSPQMVRCLLNGQVVFEDNDPPPTSPWLTLGTMTAGQARPVFRNPAITGNPQVPPEVRLIAGDFLDGWMARPYPAKLPQRLVAKEPKAEIDPNRGYYQEEAEPEPANAVYDWQAKGGELLGRKLDRPAGKPVPSNLRYARPLKAGDAIRYEFFHDPGKAHVDPSLGRVAFLLEPNGVKLHWLADAGDWTGIPLDNAIDDPAGRRGGKLPLKAGDWNKVALTATADGVKVELNGTAIYEAALPAGVNPQFGLFHNRDKTAARVRNIALTGPWSNAAPAADVAFNAAPAKPAAANARRRVLGEWYFLQEAGKVVEAAASLPPAERYQMLAGWVLPTESRPSFQLAGSMKPLDVLGVVDRKDQPPGRRVVNGGRFEAPCLELVAAARAAGTLDTLADRVAAAEPPADDPLFRRSKLALLAVVRAAQGRDADAADALRQLLPLADAIKPDAEGPERWPDLIAVLGTLDRPALRGPASDLIRAVNRNLEAAAAEEKIFPVWNWWVAAAREALARAAASGNPTETRFAHWAAVPAADASERGQGYPAPQWTFRDGTLTHLTGHPQDYLVLRTPLRGDFEVSCELRADRWHALQVRYGAMQFELTADRKKYKLLTDVRGGAEGTTITPPLPESKSDSYQFKLAVKDGWFRAAVDGREIAAEKIGPAPDPWLMLRGSALSLGEVRNLRIAGAPTVPDKIDLLAGDTLALWRSYVGSPIRVETNSRYSGYEESRAWSKRGEEMHAFGKAPEPPEDGKPVPPRRFPESAAYYLRPLLEDGAVEYEFFYDPGKAHVHPTLDRLAFLLEPDGVKLHWLTDGPQEKSKVPFDNAADEPDCRRGPTELPLKPKAWNRARLAVAGDKVKVALNGEEVYERTIEPTNQRYFGLFHYADRTEARVREAVLTGDWPKKLPPNEKLFEQE